MIKPIEDINVIGEAKDGAEAVAKAQELLPDVVLMDISMPKVDGIEATCKIKEICPKAEIIILTMYEDTEHLFRAFRAGASGYISKDCSVDELVETIKATLRGEGLLSSPLSKKVLGEFITSLSNKDIRRKFFSDLTEREMEVLKLLSHAKTDREIASALSISKKTVRNHISNIFHKLDVNARMEAVLKAAKLGLIDLEK
jgi:two-component system NarL family response regulator